MTNTAEQDQQLRVVIVGHVDHGKSTLIGRLLYDTDSLPESKLDEIKKMCDRRGTHALEWSYLLDAFQAERDQAVTIDTTQIRFATDKRDYVIIDAPGHEQFLKNMVSGAAEADAAILVVDAQEGVQEQTKRHAYLLQLLGMRQVAVMVNKMDTIDHDAQRFEKVSRDVEQYLSSLGLVPKHIVPVSARAGEMIARHSDSMNWYTGKTMVDVLDNLEPARPPVAKPMRFPVQDVYRMGDERIIVGRVESGAIKSGDEIHISPTEEAATVIGLDVWPEDPAKVKARAGEVAGIRLDKPVFVERGHIITHDDHLPMLSNVFQANIVWLGRNPMKVGNAYKVRFATCEAAVTVQSIERVIDTDDLGHNEHAGTVPRNSVAQVTLRARDLLALDAHMDNDRLGRLVIYDGYDIAGGGRIETEGFPDQRRRNIPKSQNLYEVSHLLNRDARAQQKGHHGGVIWFTGLSGAGKSTIAMAVEKALFDRGYHTYVLDGDNVRHGLNADLGFSPEDRAENIRRIGEVAALMADAGTVVITSFISPYRADRHNARSSAPDHFHEIYVQADLDTCEARDPKGLYKRAREGEIADFTGIDAPYEVPDNPELVVDTQHNDLDTCVEQVVTYISQMLDLNRSSAAQAENQPGGKEQIIA